MKAGIFSIGLDTYWPQFDGLRENLNGYHSQIRDRIAGMGIDVVDGGMVDNVEKAHDVSTRFKQEDVEILFLFISTYALRLPFSPWCRRPRSQWSCSTSSRSHSWITRGSTPLATAA